MMLTVIAIYVLVQVAISAWVARNTKSDADYLVAGRRLGVFAVAMSLFATWFGSEIVVATSAEVASDGLAGARVDPFAYALGILILGLFVVREIRRDGHMTLADYLGAKFGVGTAALSAIVIAVSGTGWAAAQLFALAMIVSSVSVLDFHTALIVSTVLVLVYTLLGGLLGDIATDLIQGGVLVVGVVLLFVLLISAAGGVGEAVSNIPPERLKLSVEEESWLDRLEIWIIPIFSSMVAQEAISRTLAARSPSIAVRGAVLGSAIYLTVGLFPIAFGMFGPQIGLTLGEGDQFLPSLAEQLLPSWGYVIFTGALLSAILSSVDSALLAASAVATDTGYRHFRPDATPRQTLAFARIATFIAGVSAYFIAVSGDSIRDLVLSAAAIGAILAPVVVIGIISKGRFGGPFAAMASIVIPGVLLIAHEGLVAMGQIEGVPGSALFTLALGFIVYGLVAFVAPRRMD